MYAAVHVRDWQKFICVSEARTTLCLDLDRHLVVVVDLKSLNVLKTVE